MSFSLQSKKTKTEKKREDRRDFVCSVLPRRLFSGGISGGLSRYKQEHQGVQGNFLTSLIREHQGTSGNKQAAHGQASPSLGPEEKTRAAPLAAKGRREGKKEKM